LGISSPLARPLPRPTPESAAANTCSNGAATLRAFAPAADLAWARARRRSEFSSFKSQRRRSASLRRSTATTRLASTVSSLRRSSRFSRVSRSSCSRQSVGTAPDLESQAPPANATHTSINGAPAAVRRKPFTAARTSRSSVLGCSATSRQRIAVSHRFRSMTSKTYAGRFHCSEPMRG